MIDGCTSSRCWPGAPDSAWPNWPQWLHDHHARRRWEEAKGAYRREHRELAEQEFGDLLAARAARL